MSALPETRLAWRPLGEILVQRGLISEIELHDALREQQHEGGRLGEILFARGVVSAVDLRDALAEQHGLDLLESELPRRDRPRLRRAPRVGAERAPRRLHCAGRGSSLLAVPVVARGNSRWEVSLQNT